MTPASAHPVDPFIITDGCAVCGRDAGGATFCHLYREGRRVALCSPQCAETFLHPPKSERNDYEPDVFDPAHDGRPDGWPAAAPASGEG